MEIILRALWALRRRQTTIDITDLAYELPHWGMDRIQAAVAECEAAGYINGMEFTQAGLDKLRACKGEE